jgi:hypothetical protein
MTTLRDEIRQTRPFTSAEQEAYLGIVRTAGLLADSLEQVLRPAGLTRLQYEAQRAVLTDQSPSPASGRGG